MAVLEASQVLFAHRSKQIMGFIQSSLSSLILNGNYCPEPGKSRHLQMPFYLSQQIIVVTQRKTVPGPKMKKRPGVQFLLLSLVSTFLLLFQKIFTPSSSLYGLEVGFHTFQEPYPMAKVNIHTVHTPRPTPPYPLSPFLFPPHFPVLHQQVPRYRFNILLMRYASRGAGFAA